MFADNIVTDRLVLKSMTEADAEYVWGIWGDLEMGKYLHDPYYESAEVLKNLFDDIETWPDYSFVAFCKETAQFIGTCSIGPEKLDDEWGIGYCVHKTYWGKGYATEMAKALIAFGIEKGIRHFTGTVATENSSSGNVMRKCGMQLDHESSFKKHKTDIVYASQVYKMHLE